LPAEDLAGSDLELARRAAQGDARVLEAIMRRHNLALFRTARAILRNDAEAEEALQEAYLRAFRSIGEFRAEAKLSTWLARIVANEAFARLRKQRRRAEIVPLQSGAAMEDLAEIAEGNMNTQPEISTQRNELRRILEAQIDALPDAYRPVFMLRAVEELSVEETATVLGIPAATVRSRFFRARSLLREALASKIDCGLEETFAFAGARCDRIVAGVLARLGAKSSPA
jgi:RNA polymerase sigma-70 factor (ECF subfamily)